MSRSSASGARRFLCFTVFMVVVSAANAQDGSEGQPVIGESLPPVSTEQWVLGEADGLEGRVVVYAFWATWCGPCRAATRLLVDLDAELSGSGLEVVGLSIERDAAAKVADYAEQFGIEYRLAIAPDLARAWGVRGIPHAIIVDGEGVVRWRGQPSHPRFGTVVRGLVAALPPVRTAAERADDRSTATRLALLGEADLSVAVSVLVDDLVEPATAYRATGVLLELGPRVRPHLWRILDEVALTAPETCRIEALLVSLGAEDFAVREAATRTLVEEPRWAGYLLALDVCGDDLERVNRIAYIQEFLSRPGVRKPWLGSDRLERVGRLLSSMTEGILRSDLENRRQHPLHPDLQRLLRGSTR